jgi:hypothetical protein
MASTCTGSCGKKVSQEKGATTIPQPTIATSRSTANNLFSKKNRMVLLSMGASHESLSSESVSSTGDTQ